jgi:hypothetical protein
MSARDLLLAAARWFPLRELLLFASLVAAAALVVYGVSLVNEPAAFITAGLLTAGLSVLFLAEAG